jgi:hypothetical protein
VSVALVVQIERWVSSSVPGWVDCEFVDADGRLHTVREKWVCVATEDLLGPDDKYPRPGFIPCEALDRWADADGRRLIRISTEAPHLLQSTDGRAEFVVLESQVVPDPWPI